MSLVKDFGLDSPVRKAILLALSIEDKDKKKLMDILHLQKVIRYFEYLLQKSDIDFSNFNLGGVSYEVTENLETLIECDLVEKTNHYFKLTKDGTGAIRELEKNTDMTELKKLLFAKQQLNDLDSDELMFFMYKLIPKTIENSTQFERLDKKKEELSKSLFLKGRINFETAVRWSGLTEEDFKKHLK